MTTQERIEKAIKDKNKRLDKTAASILVSWAINNAVNSLAEIDKIKDWKEMVRERYPFFIDLYRTWMIDNGPIEDGDTRIGEKWQEEYAKRSEIDEINSATPF